MFRLMLWDARHTETHHSNRLLAQQRGSNVVEIHNPGSHGRDSRVNESVEACGRRSR
jgi:hypothetical protein